MFKPPRWLYGAALSMEGMRRGYVGGSMLALFIIKEFGLEGAAAPTLTCLRGYLNIEEEVITRIPDYLQALIPPFIDYHESAKCFLEIVDILAELQRPRSCQIYWK